MITYHTPLESEKSRSLLLIERRFLGKQVGHRMYLSESWFELKEFGWKKIIGSNLIDNCRLYQ